MKATPKSCSCRQCKHAKHTKAGNKMVQREERAFRHAQNRLLRTGNEDILVAGARQRIG